MQDTPYARAKLCFRAILGLNVYHMRNRSTTTGYLTKFDEGPHQNDLEISSIS